MLTLQADPTLRARLLGRGQCTLTLVADKNHEAPVPCRAGQSCHLHLQKLHVPQSSGQSDCRGWPCPTEQRPEVEGLGFRPKLSKRKPWASRASSHPPTAAVALRQTRPELLGSWYWRLSRGVAMLLKPTQSWFQNIFCRIPERLYKIMHI